MPRSLEQWLAHQSAVHPETIDLGLARLAQVLERLHFVQPAVPVITVAGTNGKGSVTAYCTAILGAAGLRVGTFTSPHLRDYRERIAVAGRLVTESELLWAFERIEAARLVAPAVSLTFFEYNALAAFLVFEAAHVDAWVLEVGLGGRLDAVNVVDPSVAVVVSIGLDHQEYLGETLEAIGAEKAGIFRPGRAAVLGSREMPANVAAIARSLGARVKQLGEDFTIERSAASWQYRGSRWQLAGLPYPALAGTAQVGNAATAIAALEEIAARSPGPGVTTPGVATPGVTPDAIARGLAAVRLVGRFQVIAPPPGANSATWILDVAHNPPAARVLAANLADSVGRGRSLAVCGMLADKDAAGVAGCLRDSFDAWWLVPTDGTRGLSAAQLAERIAGAVSVAPAFAEDIGAACAAARAAAGEGDRIVIFGSFHTVGPALDWLESQGLGIR